MSGAGELHELDPVPGLPEYLPDGERILWQGQPDWWSLCRRAFHIYLLIGYFAGLVVFSLITPGSETGSALVVGIALTLLLGAVAAATFMLLALLICRTTIYTITNQRVVMQFGVALPINLNLPFSQIESAGHRNYSDGTGDIPLQLSGENRVAYLLLWPHARPWRVKRPEPMLRCLRDSVATSELLAHALTDYHSDETRTEPLASPLAARSPVSTP